MDEGQNADAGATAQVPANAGEGSQGAPDVSGLQQRINELTAARHEEARRADEATKGFQEAMQRIARLEGQVSATVQPNQREPEVDYSVFGEAADPLKKVVDSVTTRFQRQLAEQQAAFQSQLRGQQVQLMAARYNAPPEVVDRAEALAVQWAAKGLPLIPEDALRFAYGELALQGKLPAARPQGRASGGSAAGTVLHGGSPPMVPGGNGASKGPVLPTNFDNMSPAQQMQWMEKNNIDFDL